VVRSNDQRNGFMRAPSRNPFDYGAVGQKTKNPGIAGVFQLAAPRERTYQLRLRGLDRSKRYRVTWDNSGQSTVVDGFTLMNQGLAIELGGALTSELLLFAAVE